MQKNDPPWWSKHLNVIQTNLQVADTDKIDPVRLAGQIASMHGDALIFNVGGIYAWYDSKVKYHHVNEYLGEKRDLVQQVIHECHKQGIKFIARYDFNLAHDDVFGEHPEWFTQDNQRRPSIPGAYRPGNWDLLYHICINGGYRNEDVALPVLAESLEQFDLDGIFLNGPFPNPCWCDNCRRKYKAAYGVDLPQEAADIHPTWRNLQYRENLTKINSLIKSRRPDIPLILYVMFNHVLEGGLPADLLCDETRDSLSEGVTSTWQPAIRMKRCALKSQENPTWGFVHSAPGLDWRHVGLPPAEYRFWLSQLPANGATLVHSLTGVPDTIPDKRILDIVSRSNERAAKVYPYMDLAAEYADVAILWNEDNHPKAWMDVFAGLGLPFILVDKDKMTTDSLKDIRLVVLPEGILLDDHRMDLLENFVSQGASLLYEGSLPDSAARLSTLLGVQPGSVRSPFLKASYLRFLQPGDFLQEGGLENTAIIALNGEVSYSRPSTATVLATLVPPYVPDAAAGTPPGADCRYTCRFHMHGGPGQVPAGKPGRMGMHQSIYLKVEGRTSCLFQPTSNLPKS